MLIRTLLAVTPSTMADRLSSLLQRNNFTSVAVVDPARLWESLPRHSFDLLLISEDALPPEPASFVAAIRELPDQPEVVVLETQADPAAGPRAELLAAGCLAVVSAQLPERLLCETLETLLRRRREQALERLQAGAQEPPPSLDDFASAVPAMQEMLELARAVAVSDSNVLILGETGTGKERLARAIHATGPRRDGPFVAINSGAVTESLVESELFGHERGAFTGAVKTRRGYFELAHQGTIFFDEISEMPPPLQVKLLRVLEERAIRRVGGESTLDIDVRIMAATNRDLKAEVPAGRFREDLFYRLAVVTLRLLPLRERRQDLPRLVGVCLKAVCRRLGRSVPRMAPDALGAYLAHTWPGNVRELMNVLERCLLLSPAGEIARTTCRFFEAREPSSRGEEPDPGQFLIDPAWRGRPLLEVRKEAADAVERAYLIDLMRTCHGRVGVCARRAGISTRSLSEMMKRHGLRRQRFLAEETNTVPPWV